MNDRNDIICHKKDTGLHVIQIEGLWKQYRLGTINHGTLASDLQSWWARLRGRDDPNRKIDHFQKKAGTTKTDRSAEKEEKFWALRDVSIEINQGEIVGIIGRNGAGKSTLLKILSRVTTPSAGEVRIKGRVASLLEVGTGFHPELTGRENVFLNGAILGMTKQEIHAKLGEIVDFSGVERFIDTPVKRYSSGMYVRLAFAVAAHLEPEILVVDEVLAVGDAAFQKKCLNKMGEVARGGRTVLFVSHNMSAISSLCHRAILLEEGQVVADGLPEDAIAQYFDTATSAHQTRFEQPLDQDLTMCLLEASLVNQDGHETEMFLRKSPVTVELKYAVNRDIEAAHIYSNIFSSDGAIVLGTGDADTDPSRYALRTKGLYTCRFVIPGQLLNEGRYFVCVSMGIPFQMNFQENNYILSFEIHDLGTGAKIVHQRRAGVVRLDLDWEY